MKFDAISLFTALACSHSSSGIQVVSRFHINHKTENSNACNRGLTRLNSSGNFWDFLTKSSKQNGKKEQFGQFLETYVDEVDLAITEANQAITEANQALKAADNLLSQQTAESYTENDWSSMKVFNLKEALKERGLPVYGGNKADLVARLDAFEADGNEADLVAPLDAFPLDAFEAEAIDAKLKDWKDWTDDEEDWTDMPETSDFSSPVDTAEDWTLDDEELEVDYYSRMTVAQLKDKLRSMGLKVGGNKADLVGRLKSHYPAGNSEAVEAFETFDAEYETDDEEDWTDMPETSNFSSPVDTAEDWTLDDEELEVDYYSRMTVAQLKDKLRSMGLKVGGNKADLVGRLKSHHPAGNSEAVEAFETFDAEFETDDEEDWTDMPEMSDFSSSEEGVVYITCLGMSIPFFRRRDNEDFFGGGGRAVPLLDADDEEVDFEHRTVAQLKDQLKMKGLKVGGKKAELIERLKKIYSS